MIAMEKQFDRDEQARWRAAIQHLKTDPGTRMIYYPPAACPAKEIRLLEINYMMAERENDAFEPIDFGVQIGRDDGHTLMVLDVTPSQWERIHGKELQLPDGWSLDGAATFSR